jgi:endonuclease YncB( thermonuclease family)
VNDTYIRRVQVARVLDGDTFVCDVDLGFHVLVRMSCRLAGINAPEHDEPGGPQARAALAAILGRGGVTVCSVRADKYAGRFDAVVVVTGSVTGPPVAHEPTDEPVDLAREAGVPTHVEPPGEHEPAGEPLPSDVSRWMVEHGYAVPWNGTGPKPPVPWPPAMTVTQS